MPDRIVAGRPFKAEISFKAGDAPVASIESAIVTRDDTGAPRVTPVAVSTANRDAEGILRVAAVAEQSPTTMQFTLLDADGVRSEARRVVFDVAPRPTVGRCADGDCDAATVAPRNADERADGSAAKAGDRAVRGVDDRAARPSPILVAPTATGDRPASDRSAAIVPLGAEKSSTTTVAKPAPASAPKPAAERKPREGRLVPESVPQFDPAQ